MASRLGPVGKVILDKLRASFAPVHLEVQCESHMHNFGRGEERHFYVQIVSDKFEGIRIIQRHRLINECLSEELAGPVHALRIDAIPPSKWVGQEPTAAPQCRGGGKF